MSIDHTHVTTVYPAAGTIARVRPRGERWRCDTAIHSDPLEQVS